MNPLFQRILNAYALQNITRVIDDSDYNLLPFVFLVQEYNDLDLSKDYESQRIVLPARANARNLLLAERMRRYASYRTTR